MKVFKYKVGVGDYFTVQLPKGAKVLKAEAQKSDPYALSVWVLVDPNAPLEERRFRLAGTGHPIDESEINLEYINTFFLFGGDIVFHVFEVTK